MKHAEELIQALAQAAELQLKAGVHLEDVVRHILARGEEERLRTADWEHGTKTTAVLHYKYGVPICDPCLEAARHDAKDRYYADVDRSRTYQATMQRLKNVRRKIEGQCRQCSSPVAPNSTTRCPKHLLQAREAKRAKFQLRKELGLCVECGASDLETKTLCAIHARKLQQNYAKRASLR